MLQDTAKSSTAVKAEGTASNLPKCFQRSTNKVDHRLTSTSPRLLHQMLTTIEERGAPIARTTRGIQEDTVYQGHLTAILETGVHHQGHLTATLVAGVLHQGHLTAILGAGALHQGHLTATLVAGVHRRGHLTATTAEEVHRDLPDATNEGGLHPGHLIAT